MNSIGVDVGARPLCRRRRIARSEVRGKTVGDEADWEDA